MWSSKKAESSRQKQRQQQPTTRSASLEPRSRSSSNNNNNDAATLDTTTSTSNNIPRSPPSNALRKFGRNKSVSNGSGSSSSKSLPSAPQKAQQQGAKSLTTTTAAAATATSKSPLPPTKPTTTTTNPTHFETSKSTSKSKDTNDSSKSNDDKNAVAPSASEPASNNTNAGGEDGAIYSSKGLMTGMMTGEQVKMDEFRLRKIGVRFVLGCTMFSFFLCVIYGGHLYICLLVALAETLLFKELVSVRYSTYFDSQIKDTIPLFRTTQWMWFAVAMFYNYQDFVSELVQNNPKLHPFLPYVQYSGSVSFALYSATLIITITTLQREHLKFQINQLCWTVMVLCLTMGQLKYVMHNVINGLFWFVFPCCLVIFNDVMAYMCGMTMGRKFITRPFLSISPNKTWEGFVGAGICTIVVAWYFARFLAQYPWMTCSVNEFHIVPTTLECDPDPVFSKAQWIFPSQLFELFPRNLMGAIPGVVQICTTTTFVPVVLADSAEADNGTTSSTTILETLSPCVSGHLHQVHHHFEYSVTKDFCPIQVHALWLAFFASVVAPFGGFLASAIKRAYEIKNFGAVIPGHGGVMDRLDCQLLMALCTWVYYNTFIKIATVSVPKLSYLYSLLSEAEQEEFLHLIVKV